MMRILQIIGAAKAGGAESLAFGLAKELCNAGHVSSVFALSGAVDKWGQGQVENLLNVSCVASFHNGPSAKVNFQSVLALRKLLHVMKPDLIHLHTPNTALGVALASLLSPKLLGIPLVQTLHNTNVRRGRIYTLVDAVNRRADVVACGMAVATAWQKKTGTLVPVIANGLNFDWPLQDEDAKRAARSVLGVAQDAQLCLAIGKMEGSSLKSSQKGYDILIEAWLRQSPGLLTTRHLFIIGDGPLRPQLERLAGGHPSITFLGTRCDVKQWLIAADLYIMPSRHEGLAITAIEALASATPCLFSAIPEFKEIHSDAPSYVAASDPQALAEALDSWAAKSEDYRAKIALEIRRRYSIDATLSHYLVRYRRLIRREGG